MAATSSTSRPGRSPRRRSRPMDAAFRPRSPTASATRSASRPSRWARSPPTTTSTRSCWPAGPTCARSPGPTSTTRTGRCTPRPTRGTSSTGRSSTGPARAPRRPGATACAPSSSGRSRRRSSRAPSPGDSPVAAEPLQPQDLIITLLGAYVRPTVQPVWSGGMVELLSEFAFTEGAARVALTRLVRRGLIERVRSGRLVHYSVTARCERLLAEGDGRIFTLGHPRPVADGWTLLWHQIPERRRLEHSRLARRLRFLGFGSVQPGLWVSPHDHRDEVARLLIELGVAEFATMFLAAPDAGMDALVSRAWDLSGLASRYEAFSAEFSRYVGARS